MAEVYLERRQARVFTTPDELRALADQMDEKWDHSLPGGDLTVAVWSSADLLIDIVIDQGKMPRHSGLKAMEQVRRKREAV